MRKFRLSIGKICKENRPASPRQIYYRAVVAGLIDKDESGNRGNEARVQHALDYMRERYLDMEKKEDNGDFSDGEISQEFDRMPWIPFSWITDSSRTRYQAVQYDDKEQMLKETARLYRRNLWREQPYHVEVWVESESICSVVLDVTDDYGVAALPCRGQSGKRFVWDSAQAYQQIDKPVICLYIGDFDPAGLDIESSVRTRLERYGAPDFELRRIAVTPEQVRDMALVGHGLNPNYPRSQRERFTDLCDNYGIPHEAVEAEAIAPNTLRQLLRDEIEALIEPQLWAQEKAIETQEARILQMNAGLGEEADDVA